MTTIYFIRHAENEANILKQISCNKVDLALTEKGVLQAEQTAEAMTGKGLKAIFCSPMLRTRQTAEIIGRKVGLTPIVLEELKEANVGDFERVPSTPEIWKEHDEYIARWGQGEHDLRMPGGETYTELLTRARRGFFKAIQGHENEAVALVGHMGMFCFTLDDLCSNVEANKLGYVNHNCSITTMQADVKDGELKIEMLDWADASHLSGEAAKLVSGWPWNEQQGT